METTIPVNNPDQDTILLKKKFLNAVIKPIQCFFLFVCFVYLGQAFVITVIILCNLK